MCGAFRIVDAVFVLFVCFGWPAPGETTLLFIPATELYSFQPCFSPLFQKKSPPKTPLNPRPLSSPCRPPSVVPKLCLGMRPRDASPRSSASPAWESLLRPSPVVPKRRFAPLHRQHRHSGIFIPPARNSATAIFHQRNENIRNPPTIGLGLRRGGRPPPPLSSPPCRSQAPLGNASREAPLRPSLPCRPPTAAWKRQKTTAPVRGKPPTGAEKAVSDAQAHQ